MDSPPNSAATAPSSSRSITSSPPESSENIKVVVRCRPMSKKEMEGRSKLVVEIDIDNNMVTVTPPEKKDEQPKSFSFDHAFHSKSTQQEVYEKVAKPIVQNVLEGYNGTIFAYGQTGTGKTFTMEGQCDDPELKGIIPNSFAQIFKSIAEAREGQRYLVRCSYLEIYNENIRDLLCDDQSQFLELKENKDKVVYVKDLTSIVVCDADDMDRVMSNGNKNRSVASTNMNSVSSRSHAIFSIVVECSTDAGPTKGSLRMGKLNLVDLAGSERLSKTFATGDRLKEATKINLSLSNLGNVISALVDGSSHIPYRNSKLTRLLQDSLGGNSKTVMVATISPADFNYDETVSTLRYANRAKNIKNCAKINEDPKDAILRQYQEEILRLRALLEQKKHELQERAHPKDETATPVMIPKKKKNSLTKPVVTVDERIGTLLEEQKQMEEKHKNELRALLEPYGIRADGSPKEIMEELERRKAALMKDGKVVKEENERLFEELQQATDAMINSKRQCKELFHRVMYLESQLQQSLKKEEELKSKEKELAEQAAREENLRKALELKKLTSNDLKNELGKLQNDIEMKQKNLHKMTTRMQDHKDKIRRMQFAHCENMHNLQELKIDLTKELKLKKMIVDNFVPRRIRKKIEDRIRYDEEADTYKLAPRTDTKFEKPAVNRMLLHPYLNLTRFSRLARVDNVYFSNENLLAVEPEQPVPRSQELVFEEEDPAISNFIAETMQELKQELVIVCDHRKSKAKSKPMSMK